MIAVTRAITPIKPRGTAHAAATAPPIGDAADGNTRWPMWKRGQWKSALGHSLPINSAPVPINVRYASDSDHSRHGSKLTLSARSGIGNRHTIIPSACTHIAFRRRSSFIPSIALEYLGHNEKIDRWQTTIA
jgi:hypothetical protein